MTGTVAEQHLIGAVILEPRYYTSLEQLVTGDDFSDARMGQVYDRIGQMLRAGEVVDQITVIEAIESLDLVNFDSTQVFSWADASVAPSAAVDYAKAVRRDKLRRAMGDVVQVMTERAASGDSPFDIASDSMRALSSVLEGATSGRLQPKRLREILDEPDSFDWIIPGLLERQDRLILTGGEGVGKTTFARQIVLLAAAGLHPLRFERMHPVRCLVVDAENTERQWRRYVRWLAHDAAEQGVIDPRDHVFIQAGSRIDITSGSDLAEIHRLIDIHKPDLLYIGPLYKLVPKAIYSDDDAAPLIVALDSLRDRGLALVMEAHAGKAKDHHGDRSLEPRGSSQLLGWPEFGLGLRQDEDDPKRVDVVRWRGDREDDR
jgi:replicative DNA helicase